MAKVICFSPSPGGGDVRCELDEGHDGLHKGQGYAWAGSSGPSKPAKGNDPVNHPAHYTSHPSGVECIDIVEHMNFCLGNAMKYIWRAALKGGLEDIRKARWYIDREIARLGKAR